MTSHSCAGAQESGRGADPHGGGRALFMNNYASGVVDRGGKVGIAKPLAHGEIVNRKNSAKDAVRKTQAMTMTECR